MTTNPKVNKVIDILDFVHFLTASPRESRSLYLFFRSLIAPLAMNSQKNK